MTHPPKQYPLLLRLQLGFFLKLTWALKGEPKQSVYLHPLLFDAICFYGIMDDFSGVTLTAVGGRKLLFSPSHLLLRVPSVPLLSSNLIYLRNRRVDGLLAQVCGDMVWHVGAWIFLSQDASICIYIYICKHMCMYIFVCVFLKHNPRGSVVVFLQGSGEQTWQQWLRPLLAYWQTTQRSLRYQWFDHLSLLTQSTLTCFQHSN